VAVRLANIVRVETPPPVVIIAYASLNRRSPPHKLHAFMNTQFPLLLPVGVRTPPC
jgi:hypothetical protein